MRVRRLLVRHGDVLLATLLALTMTAELLAWADSAVVRSLGAGLLTTLPLAVRRRVPLASFLLTMVGLRLLSVLQPGFDNDSSTFVVAFFVALYSVGRHARGGEAWLGGLGVLGAMVAFNVSEGGLDQIDPGDVAFLLAFVGAPWAAGLAMRLRREREEALRAENDRLRRDQEERERRAVAEERARIARELHDVVSHAISVSVLQARGARRALARDLDEVRRALDAIEETTTAALGDMRRLLAVLRDTEPEPWQDSSRHPQPSLDHLDHLVDQVREAGVPVSVEVEGPPRPVPPGVDLSAYRIVQEALTNVLTHTRGARATVTLTYADDALGVRVSDDGAPLGPSSRGSGQGLIGIHERVAVVGGDVVAGPLEHGGFEVRVRLPFALEPVG